MPENITDYTASMWKYFPVSENEPEVLPEYLVKSEICGKSTVIASRVRGKKHKHDGTNCDDWFETASDGDIIYIAVADGAGSKKYSGIGAREACRTVCGYLKYTFEKSVLSGHIISDLSSDLKDEKCISACKILANTVQDSVKKAYSAVESAFYSRVTDKSYSECLGRTLNIEDFSSTLLVAVVIPLESDDSKKLIISFQIGDGAIVLVNTNETFEKSVKLMGESDSGDFSGETDFLTSVNLPESANLAVRTRISVDSSDILMLMTDGVSDDYFPPESQMQRLYLDLSANGILSVDFDESDLPEDIPEPDFYSWVNDKTIKVGLNYTKNICEKSDISLESLWNDRRIIKSAEIKSNDLFDTDNPSERLKIWLDNYIERGSFDDRTLVIVRM